MFPLLDCISQVRHHSDFLYIEAFRQHTSDAGPPACSGSHAQSDVRRGYSEERHLMSNLGYIKHSFSPTLPL
jgi:hypothetical protein